MSSVEQVARTDGVGSSRGQHAASPRPLPRRRPRLVDLACVVLLIALVGGIELAVRHAAVRPLWYDELWRAHFLSAPAADFWSGISMANAPSALGWVALSRGAADLFGWHEWVLRTPQLVTLPLLAAGTYALTRRFTGPATALVAAALLGVSGTITDLATQFKPYTVEAICAIAVMALWLARPAGSGGSPGRVARRTLAGALTVFTVPLAFLIGPLALADVVLVRGGRQRLRAGLEAAPAVLLTGAHALLFVARQSGQRKGDYWNGHFLAGRGFGGGLRFVGHQVLAIAGAAPSGVDRTDLNLVHPVTDGTAVATWGLAPAFGVAFLLGALVLLRRADGRVTLFGVLGAEAMELAASADRYWPFGPTRTNLFLVPLLVLVPAIGIGDLVGRARHRLLLAPAAFVLVAVTIVALVSASSSTRRLYDHQRDPRLIDQLGAATQAASALARPGDLTVVAGPLVRPGWLYSMDVSADRPAALRPIPAAETVFVPYDGAAADRSALVARAAPPRQVLLFSLDIERSALPPALARLRAGGFCPVSSRQFPLTGRLMVLRAC